MAIPGKVLSVSKGKAIVDFLGQNKEADCSLMPCKPREYVVVNAGFVVEKVPEQEALASIEMLKNGKC